MGAVYESGRMNERGAWASNRWDGDSLHFLAVLKAHLNFGSGSVGNEGRLLKAGSVLGRTVVWKSGVRTT